MSAGNGPTLWESGLSEDRIKNATTPQLVRAHVLYKVQASHHTTPADATPLVAVRFHRWMVEELRTRGVLD